jgi:hypothetical protein
MNYQFCEIDTEPENIINGMVYVCKNDMLMFLRCPCLCQHIYKLNMSQELKNTGTPKWVYLPPNTITPSINHTANCKTHFTITNGITTFY